jgi:hypothetical protein
MPCASIHPHRTVHFDRSGDGKADLAIYRGGTWYVNTKLDGSAQAIFSYGTTGDVPLAWTDPAL